MSILDDELDKRYAELAGAIVGQAADEYIKAFRDGNRKKCARLEQWFLSPYGQILSMHHGEFIIENCRKIAKQGDCDIMKRNE